VEQVDPFACVNDGVSEIVCCSSFGVKGKLGRVRGERRLPAPPLFAEAVRKYAAGILLRTLAPESDGEDLRAQRVVPEPLTILCLAARGSNDSSAA